MDPLPRRCEVSCLFESLLDRSLSCLPHPHLFFLPLLFFLSPPLSSGEFLLSLISCLFDNHQTTRPPNQIRCQYYRDHCSRRNAGNLLACVPFLLLLFLSSLLLLLSFLCHFLFYRYPRPHGQKCVRGRVGCHSDEGVVGPPCDDCSSLSSRVLFLGGKAFGRLPPTRNHLGVVFEAERTWFWYPEFYWSYPEACREV